MSFERDPDRIAIYALFAEEYDDEARIIGHMTGPYYQALYYLGQQIAANSEEFLTDDETQRRTTRQEFVSDALGHIRDPEHNPLFITYNWSGLAGIIVADLRDTAIEKSSLDERVRKIALARKSVRQRTLQQVGQTGPLQLLDDATKAFSLLVNELSPQPSQLPPI